MDMDTVQPVALFVHLVLEAEDRDPHWKLDWTLPGFPLTNYHIAGHLRATSWWQAHFFIIF